MFSVKGAKMDGGRRGKGGRVLLEDGRFAVYISTALHGAEG